MPPNSCMKISPEIKKRHTHKKKCWRGANKTGENGASIGVPGYTNASHPFEGAASTSVPWYTKASLPFLHFCYKYPHCPFWKNHVEFYVEIDEEIDEKVR